MKAVWISLCLSLIVSHLVLRNKIKTAVLIIIFMLVINFTPFHNRIIESSIHIGTSGLLIFIVWVLLNFKKDIFNKNIFNWKNLTPKIISLYYFLIMGFVLALFYINDGVEYIALGKLNLMTPVEQIINNSIYILLVIFFFKILVNFQYDELFLSKMAKIFIFTIFINMFSQLTHEFGFENFLWGLFSPKRLIVNVDEIRNFGLFYSFGMGVYVVLIVALSMLYYQKHKYISIFAILSSFVFSLYSGTRQTVIFLGLFSIIFILVYIFKNKLKIRHILLISLLLIGFIIGFNKYFSNMLIFQRLFPAISSVEKGDVLRASNRDIDGIPYVYKELKTFPIWGKGVFNFDQTKNSDTNIAGHVIWFNIYKKFGIIGLMYLLIVFVYPIKKLFRICMKEKNKIIFRECSILFSLMCIVFLQQFWDNFFWFSDTMLLYSFIYFWFFSFINRRKRFYKKNILV